MSKVRILMPSCEEPNNTSNFVLGARLLEYLINFKKNPGTPFFSFSRLDGETNIFLLRDDSDEDNEERSFFIFSDDDFCDNIENEFKAYSGSVESIGKLVRHIYEIIEDAAQRAI